MIVFRYRKTLKACAACALALAFAVACGAVPASAQKKKKAAPGYTVAAATTMRLRLNDKTTSASADNEGEVKGKSSTKKNVGFIGAGLVVGGLINGVAGAATGGLIGVGRGLIKKGEEAEVKSGTEFDVILNRAVTLKAYR